MNSVMQSDQNSSKADTFHEPTTYEPHVQTSSEKIIEISLNEYGRVTVFTIEKRSLVQKNDHVYGIEDHKRPLAHSKLLLDLASKGQKKKMENSKAHLQ